ncbi:MAG: hypothetical protein IT572_09580 [Deltaproteobacteria bacterium]|nr:hypothetical protein [Deltaproteobacteria bacterium]
MTPPIHVDLYDLAVRAREAAEELLFGPPAKTKAPAKKEKAEKARAIRLFETHHRRLMKQLEEYRKKLDAPVQPQHGEAKDASALDKIREGVELGALIFCPYLLPLGEVAREIAPALPFRVELSFENLKTGLREFNRRAEEGRAAFKKSIEGAIWNPTSLEELSQGSLFVIEQEALNDIIAGAIADGPAASKVRNVRVEIDGDRLKIKGEYKTKLMWVDFSAILEFEQKNGRSEGTLKKIEAAGIDLGDCFKEDILGAFGRFGFPPPEDAELNDLAWVSLPGIVRFEITRDKVIIERQAPSTGPS